MHNEEGGLGKLNPDTEYIKNKGDRKAVSQLASVNGWQNWA